MTPTPGFPDRRETVLYQRTVYGQGTRDKTGGFLVVMIGSYAALLTTWVALALLL